MPAIDQKICAMLRDPKFMRLTSAEFVFDCFLPSSFHMALCAGVDVVRPGGKLMSPLDVDAMVVYEDDGAV